MSQTIPLVSQAIPLVSQAIPLVSQAIPLVSQAIYHWCPRPYTTGVPGHIPLVSQAVPLVSQAVLLNVYSGTAHISGRLQDKVKGPV